MTRCLIGISPLIAASLAAASCGGSDGDAASGGACATAKADLELSVSLPAAPSASRRQATTDATGIGGVLPPRPRAARPRPETDDLMPSPI